MINVDDLRKDAEQAVPDVRCADSPTIKAYTDWSALEQIFSLDAPPPTQISGARPLSSIPFFSFSPSSNRILARHFSHIPSFFEWDGSPRISSTSGFQHLIIHVHGKEDVFLEDLALDLPKTLTIDVVVDAEGALRFHHLVNGKYPQYTHLRIHLGRGASFLGRLALTGDAHVHYEAFLREAGASFSISGVSSAGRSDVVTDALISSERNVVDIRHLLLSSPSDFLVHRGVVRVDPSSSEASADVESAFITSGGFVAAVPQLEVLAHNVRRASHRVKDLRLDVGRLFYLQSRGLSEKEAWHIYLERMAEAFLGELADERASSTIKTFAERSFPFSTPL